MVLMHACAGYTGLGCNTCAGQYAPSNSNVFICFRCATNTIGKMKHAFMFLAGDVAVFSLSWAPRLHSSCTCVDACC